MLPEPMTATLSGLRTRAVESMANPFRNMMTSV